MAKPVRQFITAGSANEEVPAKSVFAPLFSEAINGKADLNHDGYVTGSELGMFLSDSVPKYKRQNPQYGKIDDYELSRGDFIFLAPSNKRKKPTVSSTFALTIHPTPSDASVQITNITPKYHDGIRLAKGDYTIKVSRAGYQTKVIEIQLLFDRSVNVDLEKTASSSTPVTAAYDPAAAQAKALQQQEALSSVQERLAKLQQENKEKMLAAVEKQKKMQEKKPKGFAHYGGYHLLAGKWKGKEPMGIKSVMNIDTDKEPAILDLIATGPNCKEQFLLKKVDVGFALIEFYFVNEHKTGQCELIDYIKMRPFPNGNQMSMTIYRTNGQYPQLFVANKRPDFD